jgi:predicted metal-dependent hydrolase
MRRACWTNGSHELAHRLELNHSERFWNEVKKLCPDYQEREAFLRENEIRYRAW